MPFSSTPQIAVSWHGLPFYAARLIRAGIQSLNEPVAVIATFPKQNRDDLEEELGQSVYWIDSKKHYSWQDLALEIPEIYFQSGWLSKAFNSLGHEVQQGRGSVICLSDNIWEGGLKQWAGALLFRLKYKSNYKAFWVPGEAGTQYCQKLGINKSSVYRGMYGADPVIFASGLPIQQRKKQFLFVGQLIERKGIDLLINSFNIFSQDFPEWTLLIIGDGSLYFEPNNNRIRFEKFQPARQIAVKMRESRFLILPSLQEHWGLVVHEASLSGCGLLVSESVGATPDLVTLNNGFVFQTNSVSSLHNAIVKAATMNDFELSKILTENKIASAKFGPHSWSKSFVQIIHDIRS